jgi:hypothetical protein
MANLREFIERIRSFIAKEIELAPPCPFCGEETEETSADDPPESTESK